MLVKYPFDASAFEADIYGLPQREPGSGEKGQDPLESAVSAFLDELRRGRAPSVEEYARRQPQLAAQLRELLPLAAAMEQWKSTQEVVPDRSTMPADVRFERLGDCRMLREIGRGGM